MLVWQVSVEIKLAVLTDIIPQTRYLPPQSSLLVLYIPLHF